MMKTASFRYLWLITPLPVLLLSWPLLGGDSVYFLVWWFALLIISLMAWPIAAKLFPAGDKGWMLARPLGLVLFSLPVWLLSHLRVLPISRWSLLLTLALLFILTWLLAGRLRSIPRTLENKPVDHQALLRRIGCAEAVFAAALLAWTFARGLKPDLDSLEKFMNIGFMNSIWRSHYLPAQDMWFAGQPINYYYYGQYLYGILSRLTGIRPEIAYNLGMASTMALTLATTWSIADHLMRLAARRGRRLLPLAPAAAGLVTSVLVTFGGNSQAFLFKENSPGHALTRWLAGKGLISADPDKAFWFADSTRFIGYNPDTADKTIHEFPFYSFLVADLHAHVINLTFVLLLIAVLVYYIHTVQPAAAVDSKSGLSQLPLRWLHELRDTVRRPGIWAIGVLLSLFMMCNFWDYVIYLVLTAMVFLWVNSRRSGRLTTLPGFLATLIQAGLVMLVFLRISQPLRALLAYGAIFLLAHALSSLSRDGASRTGAQISTLFFISHLLAFPFNLNFEPIAKTLALTVNRTPFWQMLSLWGAHLLAGLLILAAGIVSVLRRRPVRNHLPLPDEPSQPIGLTTRLTRKLSRLAPADIMIALFFLAGTGLIIIPELIYVVDIYSGDFKRANTMFKFTYQAYILLSLAWGTGLTMLAMQRRTWWHQRSAATRVIAVLLTGLLIIPFSYPFTSARQWLGRWQISRYQGIDGLSPIADKTSPQILEPYQGELAADVAAIRWFNRTVTGQPVILEAFGESYTDYCRISAFTGLPTVMGWETHQWLWRTSRDTPQAYGTIVLRRQDAVRTLYTTTDPALRRELIETYQIRYIIVGNLERQRFAAATSNDPAAPRLQEELLKATGRIVFSQDDLYVIEVKTETAG